jgi:EAL domain-containing protein (putative c-di-GMP-specific phosphodiesterase class I)
LPIEGITGELQVGELIKLGCEQGQGFYFAHPSNAQGIEALSGLPDRSELPV